MFEKWFGKNIDKNVKKVESERDDVRKIIDKIKEDMRKKPFPILPAPAPKPTASSISGIGHGFAYPAISSKAWTTATGYSSINITGTAHTPSSFTIGSNINNASSVVTFNKVAGQEIVRLNKDGTITWANGIEIDEAADAFGRSIVLGAEMVAGISKGAKLRMRNSVFADLIQIAAEKGSLTADDLTYLLEASKIVEKLKGEHE